MKLLRVLLPMILLIFFGLVGNMIILTLDEGDQILEIDIPGYYLELNQSIFRFQVIGDFGELHPYEKFIELPCKRLARRMSEWALKEKTSMVLSVGDNFYPTKDENILDEVKDVFKIFWKFKEIKKLPWILIYGNHDYYKSRTLGKDIKKMYKNIVFPDTPWNMTVNLNNTLVSFTYLSCDLICHGPYMNYVYQRQCNKMKASRDFSKEYAWLDNHLGNLNKDQRVKWKIVVMHYPIFSVSTTGLDSENMKYYLLPILYKHKVDVVLTGHNHNMQYFTSDYYQVFQNQTENLKCLNDSRIRCGDGFLMCKNKKVKCLETGLTCENVICRDDSMGKFGIKKKEYVKGTAIHQIVQGAGGADLDPMCPLMESPMANYEFGLSDYGFTQISISNEEMHIKFIKTKDSSVAFESIIKSTDQNPDPEFKQEN